MNMLARKFKSETQAKIIGLSGNALSAAGVLADDDAPSGAAGGEADKPPVESVPIVHVEQKVLLVQALLSVGHWAPALAMLARWPVIAHYHSAISDILLRMVRVMIEPAYRPLEAELAIASDGPGLAPARPSATDDLPKKSQATLVLPQPLDTVRTAFRYFYPRWLDDLPVCTDMAEVAERVRPFLRLVGPLGARDVQVLVWLCRIGIHQRQQDVRLPAFLEHGNDRPDGILSFSHPRRSPTPGPTLSGAPSFPLCRSSIATSATITSFGRSFSRSHTTFGTPSTASGMWPSVTGLARRIRRPWHWPPHSRMSMSGRPSDESPLGTSGSPRDLSARQVRQRLLCCGRPCSIRSRATRT